MDQRHIERLREEQQIAIQQTQTRIDELQKFKDDYKALHQRLTTLPDKVKHEVMVPFGKLAFMPGELIHTNEITVLLGDNWFAERSAKQANEIIDRRITAIDDQIKDFEKQQGLLQPRLEFTSELQDIAEARGDVFEIKEELNEEEEKRWREKHKERVRAQKMEEKKERIKIKEAETEKESLTEEELWLKLDELEQQEHERNEMNRYTDSDETETADEESETESESEDEKDTKKVKWKDVETRRQSLPKSSSDEEERAPAVIRFTHTKTEQDQPSKPRGSGDSITSPGDIFREFGQPKSILKPSRDTPYPQPQEPKKEVIRTILPGSLEAFSGAVVERKETSGEEKTDQVIQNEPPKRVSRFKAQRMQQGKR